jgi:hypothetical protein
MEYTNPNEPSHTIVQKATTNLYYLCFLSFGYKYELFFRKNNGVNYFFQSQRDDSTLEVQPFYRTLTGNEADSVIDVTSFHNSVTYLEMNLLTFTA